MKPAPRSKRSTRSTGPADVSVVDAEPESPRRKPGSTSESRGVGEVIRQIRTTRNLSLADLASLSGLSIALISQIERGVNSPSMRSLRQLAHGLGVGVEMLFSSAGEEGASTAVVRHHSRRVLNLGKTGIIMELLTPSGFEGLQTFHSYIVPGGSSGPEYDSHVGTESGLVMAGSFELWLDGTKQLLGPGDSFSFQSPTPHRYLNPGKTMCQIYWVITPPIY